MTEQETTGDDPLAQVVDELQKQFPTVGQEIIAAHVRQAHAQLDSAPVQDYASVLVQRQARLSLAAMIGTDATTPEGTEHAGAS
ncbi:hypothetical protein ODJ79_40810 [Actinoplanes sp. KI2]|uniref:three-helix bundle dimerization domain-containing protein n=1 Tax=Actinoplanes sp. KI2 TaxID=2983315 RepID=UPI0021D5AE63|nr:hypothetical protein [Actinoplanes sp. KI2]MCU7730095.1 hypothetical protein [Actinoplanes sp. KI2]